MHTRQISLFTEDTHFEIKKHSSIVQMSSIATLQERKVMNVLLWIAKDHLKRNPDERVFVSDLGILKRLAGLKKNDNTKLKEALRHLADMTIEYNIMWKDHCNERGIFKFISEAKIKEEGIGKPTTLTFEFPTTILDTIKRPNMFVKLDLTIIKGLESKHSIILYEFIKDYLNIGKIRCDIPLFRKLMGIQPNQYNNFTMLKKRVLDIAVQEINEKTDINISFDFEKIGRINTAVLFTMQPKQNSLEDHTLTDTVKNKLLHYGIQEDTINQLIQKHDLEYIQANLKIVEEQLQKGKIQNIAGYLLKAFQSDFRMTETPYEKELQEETERKLQQQQEEKTQQEEAKKQEAEQTRLKKEQVQEYLNTLSEQEREELQEKFIKKIQQNSVTATIYSKYGVNNPLMENNRINFVTENRQKWVENE